MKIMPIRSGRAWTAAIALAASSSVWAQQPGEGAARNARPGDLPAAGMISPGENDARIARWLEVDNRMVLECAKVGKERATGSEVRSFAENVTAEHQKCVDDLRRVAKAKKDDRVSAASGRAENERKNLGDTTPDRRRTAVLVQDQGQSRDARMVFRPTDFVAVHEDVYKHLHNTMKKEWENVNGADFDRAFMKHQVMAHEMLLASMRSVRPTASTEMRRTLDLGIEKVQDHLKQARELCDRVCREKTEGASR